MGVDLRAGKGGVTQEFLDCHEIGTPIKEVSCERMTERMDTESNLGPRRREQSRHSLLNRAAVESCSAMEVEYV